MIDPEEENPTEEGEEMITNMTEFAEEFGVEPAATRAGLASVLRELSGAIKKCAGAPRLKIMHGFCGVILWVGPATDPQGYRPGVEGLEAFSVYLYFPFTRGALNSALDRCDRMAETLRRGVDKVTPA
jgi:hypothetical protein